MGTSSQPVYPYPGGTPGAEPPAPVVGQAGHIDWSNWIKQFVKNLDTQSAKLTGDTFTGPIVSQVNVGSHNLKLIYDGSPGVTLRGTTGGLDVRNSTASARTVVKAASPVSPEDLVTKEYADALAQNALQSALPIGSIVMFASVTPPSGWLLCNGQSTTGYTELAAIVGATVPDLRDRFVIGYSATKPIKSTGGAATVTLTAAQSGVPAHSHPVTVNPGDTSSAHSHTVDPPATNTGYMSANNVHGHSVSGSTNGAGGYVGNYMIQGSDTANNGIWFVTQTVETLYTANHTHSVTGTAANVDTNHYHGVDIPAFNSGTASINHSHTATGGNNTAAAASAAHDNIPPYYALAFIIKAV